MEAWYPIPDTQGKYAISDHGRVMRLVSGTNARPGHILSQKTTCWGYAEVRLHHGAKLRSIRVHKLVMSAVVGPTPDGTQVNHKDGNKLNNHISNLEYVTQTENIRHANRLGLIKPAKGSRLPQARLTEPKVVEIRRALARGESQGTIAGRYGVVPSTISYVARGKTWAHVQ